MKKIILSVIMLVSLLTMAQETPANKFFESHSGKEGYSSVYITKYMFELFSKVSNNEEDKEFKEVTSKLKSIKILTVDSLTNINNQKTFEKELSSILRNSEYKEMMVIKDGAQTVKFIINEKNDKISEFLMMIYGGDKEPVLIFLEGDINLKKISKLSKTMNVDGFQYLDNIDKKGK